MYLVYIIYSPTLDKYYVGATADIEGRLRRHNAKSKGFTARANDWTVKYTEPFNDKQSAQQREKEIKSWKVGLVGPQIRESKTSSPASPSQSNIVYLLQKTFAD